MLLPCTKRPLDRPAKKSFRVGRQFDPARIALSPSGKSARSPTEVTWNECLKISEYS